MYKKLLSMLIILLIILNLFNIALAPLIDEELLPNANDTGKPKATDPIDVSDDTQSNSVPGVPINSSQRTAVAGTSSILHIESNPHGGSWLDGFGDSSGIDLNYSDNLNVTDGDVKILKSPPQPLPVDSNTVALWHLNEGSGSTTSDSSPNGNTGTLLRSTTWTSGRFGNGLYFSGGGQWFVGDVVNVPHSSSIDVTGNITIEAWIKAKGTDRYHIIVDKYENKGPGMDYGYTLYLTYGKLRLSIYSGSTFGDYTGNTDLRDDKWHYVMGVFNGTSINLYVDCVLEGKKTYNVPPASTNINLGIGLRQCGFGCYGPFLGSIDEVRISNVARDFTKYANLTSTPINLTSGMHWDTIIINKTEPQYTTLAVTILNASDNQPIPGSQIFTGDGEFDISNIDPVKYQSIKLQASFVTESCQKNPVLHYWGVSWNATNAWRDSLFGGLKCSSQFLTHNDGDSQMQFQQSQFVITSTADFDNGIKSNVSTHTDSSAIPDNELQLYKIPSYTIFTEDFEGIVGQDVDVYNSNWTVNITDGSTTMQIDNTHFINGIKSLKWFADASILGGNALIERTVPNLANNELIFNVRSNVVTLDLDSIQIKTYDNLSNSYANFFFGLASGNIRKLCYFNGTNLIITSHQHTEDVWYKVKIIHHTGSGTWSAWIDGGSYNNFRIVSHANRRQSGTNSITKLCLGGRNAHSGQQVEFWVDYIRIIVPAKYVNLGTWESSNQIIPLNHHLLDTTLTFSGLAVGKSEIDKIEWLVGSNVKAIYNNDIEINALSPLTITEPDLTAGSFIDVDSDFTIKIYLTSDSTLTPIIEQIEGYSISSGTLTSEPISIPVKHVWNTLIFNTTTPANTSITVTIIDHATNIPVLNFTRLPNSTIDLSGLDPNIYPVITLVADFNSTDGVNTPILHDWSVNWTYANEKPIANAGPNQTVFESQQVIFNGTGSNDPDGSIVNWSWDIDADGVYDLFGPYANYTYNDDSVNNATLMVTDDQGASDTDYVMITVLNLNSTIDDYNLTILQAYPRTIGYWKHQCKIASPKGDHTGIKPEYITGINSNSSVFTTLSTKDDILRILEPDDPSNMIAKAEQQLMGLWLNVVSGKLGTSTALNLTSLTAATTVSAALAEIELIILNPNSNRSELERAKDIADSINNGIGLITTTILDIHASDPGSDDITLTIDWNDGSANTTIIFFNNDPINTTDPYPSQFSGLAPFNIHTTLNHKYNSSGNYLIIIMVHDDDGGQTIIKVNINI